MWLLLFLFVFPLSEVRSQFPKACTTPEAIDSKTCCPMWKNSSCGEESGRGRCEVFASYVPILQVDDDRFNWPSDYFSKLCACKPRYSGFDCGRCSPGYRGDNCDRLKNVTRKDIRDLTHGERMKFFGYLSLLKHTESEDYVILTSGDRHDRNTYTFVTAFVYDIFTWMHYYASAPLLINNTLYGTTNFNHRGPAFPVWHRMFLLLLENEIQRFTGDEDFGLPYYDWSRDNGCSICTNKIMGESLPPAFLSPKSYFGDWKAICSSFNFPDQYCSDVKESIIPIRRKPGSDPSNRHLPSWRDVENTLEWKDYDTPPYDKTSKYSFRNILEGFMDPKDGVTARECMHNLVHDYMMGTMGQVPISANDPIFYLHHAYIDMIFEKWIQNNNATPYDYPEKECPKEQEPDGFMVPFIPPVKNRAPLKPSPHFGYTYIPYSGLGVDVD
ncbi:tyrosinase-like [Lissotriton helveticus]